MATGPAGTRRLLLMVLALAALVAGAAWILSSSPDAPVPPTTVRDSPRATHPELAPETPVYTSANFRMRSTASEPLARDALARMEAVLGVAAEVLPIESGPRMELVLFANRKEFRRAFPRAGWAEALYLKPVAYAYPDADTPRFDHWLVHEGAHQFIRERTQIRAPRWIEEGLASWLSTAMIRDGVPDPSRLDPATYPVWWYPDVAARSGSPQQGVSPRALVPAAVLFGYRAGPDPDAHVNAYYVSALELVRFLMHGDGGRYRDSFLAFLDSPGSPEDFERTLGWVTDLDVRWQHGYRLRAWPTAAGAAGPSGPP